MRLIVIPRVVSPRFVSSWGVSRRFSWCPSARWSSARWSTVMVSTWASAWAPTWSSSWPLPGPPPGPPPPSLPLGFGGPGGPLGFRPGGVEKCQGGVLGNCPMYVGREFPRLIGLVGERTLWGVPWECHHLWVGDGALVWVVFGMSVSVRPLARGLLRLWWKVQRPLWGRSYHVVELRKCLWTLCGAYSCDRHQHIFP